MLMKMVYPVRPAIIIKLKTRSVHRSISAAHALHLGSVIQSLTIHGGKSASMVGGFGRFTGNRNYVLMAVVILTLLKHNRPLSHGGHVESQENKSFVFALNSGLAEVCREKTKLFYSPESQHGCHVIRVYGVVISSCNCESEEFGVPKLLKLS